MRQRLGALLRRAIPAALFVLAGFWADDRGAFAGLNDQIGDARAALVPRDASGEVVVVAIDAASLQAVGVWPWSRRVHADLLTRLTAAGPRDVLFDIDFSFAADPAGDRAFAAALDASGVAYLAGFVQRAAPGSPAITTNLPLPAFAERAWLAAVNVVPDADGAVRHYPYAVEIDGATVPSAGSLLAGAYVGSLDAFPLNLSIRPGSISTVSAIDVLEGRVPPETFAGRSVVVGATAVELGDQISLPIHGVQPGPVVHVLAAEALAHGAVPVTLRPGLVLLALFGAMLAFQTFGLRRPVAGLVLLAVSLGAAEAAALSAYASAAILVPTAPVYPVLGAFVLWQLVGKILASAWTIRRQAAEIRDTAALLGTVFEDSSDAIIVVAAGGEVLRHSRSARQLLHCDGQDRTALPDPLRRHAEALLNGQLPAGDGRRCCEVACAGRTRLLDVTGSLSMAAGAGGDRTTPRPIVTPSVRDVTVERQQAERIAFLSDHDETTGALRRHAFLDRLGSRLEAGTPAAVFVLRLRGVESVNSLLGRDVGDELLARVARRLETSEPGVPAVARLGGKSFAVLSGAPLDAPAADRLAQRLLEDIEEPFSSLGIAVSVGASVGYTVRPAGAASTAAEVLNQAEAATQIAEANRLARPMLYDPALADRQLRARRIEREMAAGLDRQEFEVVYQPQHRVADGALVGSEALLRWTSPCLGPVRPDEFIPIAESTGFIADLGRWVLRRALRDMRNLPGHLSVAVNVSAAQMGHGTLMADISDALSDAGVPASRLWLELTETVLLDGSGGLVETMSDIRFRGVRWALDDFGTGYSSMAYLSRLPIDKIKLDRAFVAGLGDDPAALPVLRAINGLCRSLDLPLLCEGVENDEHLAVLRAHGCAEAQGFLFARPLSLPDFIAHARACGADPAADGGRARGAT